MTKKKVTTCFGPCYWANIRSQVRNLKLRKLYNVSHKISYINLKFNEISFRLIPYSNYTERNGDDSPKACLVFSVDPGLKFLYRLNRFSRHFSAPSNKWKDNTSNYHNRRHHYPIAINTYYWNADSVCAKLVRYNIRCFALSPYFHANLLKHKKAFHT